MNDPTALDTAAVRLMLLHVADKVIENEPLLSKADRDIGDGDHGIGMKRGFTAVLELLQATDPDATTVSDLFLQVGNTLLRRMGGASGVIFGLLFRPGVGAQKFDGALTVPQLADLFQRASDTIATRGGATVGDKTMLDALVPAVDALTDAANTGVPLVEALRRAGAAADGGALATKQQLPRFGKAVSLGARAIGYPDAGALSTAVIFNAIASWAQTNLRPTVQPTH